MPKRLDTNRTDRKPSTRPETSQVELRRWIDHVIVPILVEQFRQKLALKPERANG